MSNYDIDEESKARDYNLSNQNFSHHQDQLLSFDDLRKSQENTYQHQSSHPQQQQLQSNNDTSDLRLNNQLQENPLYEDFLLTNQMAEQDEKLSQCSEPANNLQNLKIINQSGKHSLINKDSSSFRYDTYDLEGAPEFGDSSPDLIRQKDSIKKTDGQQEEEEKERQQYQEKLKVREKDTENNNRKLSENQSINQSANLNNQSEIEYQIQGQQQMNSTKGLQEKDQSYEKLASMDLFDQSQINIVNKGPRRPLSPYIFFSQEKRKELKREHPDWNSSQIMKMVSVLWQKMSADQKRDFQEQSKKDRERYENERQQFVHKKIEDEPLEEGHTVLETVKNRSRILKQQQKNRKQSEDHIYYTDNLLPRKSRRDRRESGQVGDDDRDDSSNQEGPSKRVRKVSKDSKMSLGHSSHDAVSFQNNQANNFIKEEEKHRNNQIQHFDKEKEQKLFSVSQQQRKQQIQSYSSGDIRNKIENERAQRPLEAMGSDKMANELKLQINTTPSPFDKKDQIHQQRNQDLQNRKPQIGSVNSSETGVVKHRILPSPLVSSTSLQNYYTPNESPYAQNYIRNLPSPTPQTIAAQRIPYQSQFQPQIPQIYQGHPQILQGYAIQQQPQYIGIGPGQFIQSQQLGQPSQYITAASSDQFINPQQQMAYLIQQQQQQQLQQQQQQQQQQTYYDQNCNLQQIPQGNPQNPPHTPIQQQNSSHELAQFFQASQNQNNPGLIGYQSGNNQNFNFTMDEQMKQQQQQHGPISGIQQINIQPQNYPGFQSSLVNPGASFYPTGQGWQQNPSGFQSQAQMQQPDPPKLLQRESSGSNTQLRNLQQQQAQQIQGNNNDDEFNEFQNNNNNHNHLQRLSSTNIGLQGLSGAPFQIPSGLLLNTNQPSLGGANNGSSSFLQYPFTLPSNLIDSNIQFQPFDYPSSLQKHSDLIRGQGQHINAAVGQSLDDIAGDQDSAADGEDDEELMQELQQQSSRNNQQNSSNQSEQ